MHSRDFLPRRFFIKAMCASKDICGNQSTKAFTKTLLLHKTKYASIEQCLIFFGIACDFVNLCVVSKPDKNLSLDMTYFIEICRKVSSIISKVAKKEFS
jgi:hypothetical protein